MTCGELYVALQRLPADALFLPVLVAHEGVMEEVTSVTLVKPDDGTWPIVRLEVEQVDASFGLAVHSLRR